MKTLEFVREIITSGACNKAIVRTLEEHNLGYVAYGWDYLKDGVIFVFPTECGADAIPFKRLELTDISVMDNLGDFEYSMLLDIEDVKSLKRSL